MNTITRKGCDTLFTANWDRVLMIHFEVDAGALQRETPFELDLLDGRAFVTLVAFTMRGMRFRGGGAFGRWLVWPIATHEFLNVRTYVRHDGEAGIQFLAEWLPNRLACWLGPRVFSLPYRHGKIRYDHAPESRHICGRVCDARSGERLRYRATFRSEKRRWNRCAAGSRDEWLMERYIAFNAVGGRARSFRVAHEPWRQAEVSLDLEEDELLRANWPWLRAGACVGGNYSPGLREVGMGRPHRVELCAARTVAEVEKCSCKFTSTSSSLAVGSPERCESPPAVR